MKDVNIYLAALWLGKYPPLFTSTSGNNYFGFFFSYFNNFIYTTYTTYKTHITYIAYDLQYIYCLLIAAGALSQISKLHKNEVLSLPLNMFLK